MQRKIIICKRWSFKRELCYRSFSEIIKPSINEGMGSSEGLIYSDSENKLLTRYRELLDEVFWLKQFTPDSRIMKALESKLELKKEFLAQKLSINNALSLIS